MRPPILALACLVGVIVALLASCSPVRIGGVVEGQLIDADTQQPIQGAAIWLGKTAHCAGVVEAYSRYLPPLETLTNEEGRFRVGSGVTIAPNCMAVAWSDFLRILAPGYFLDHLAQGRAAGVDPQTDFHDLRSTALGLDRLRYFIELEHYRRIPKLPEMDYLLGKGGPVWQEAVAKVRSVPFRPQGAPGVFAIQEGATFDQIVAVNVLRDRVPRRRTVIFVRDRNKGTVHGWTTKGTQLSLPFPTGEGWSIVGEHRRLGYPFLTRNNGLYFLQLLDFSGSLQKLNPENWSSGPSQLGGITVAATSGHFLITVEAGGLEFGFYRLEERLQSKDIVQTSILPGPLRSVSDVLPGGRSPIECLTNGGPESDSLVIVANTAEGRALFLLPWEKAYEKEWKAVRVTVPPGILTAEVTACASTRSPIKSLYLAIKDKGIRRLVFRSSADAKLREVSKYNTEEAPFWEASKRVVLESEDGPKNFIGLATAELESVWEVVYGVTGDNAIYRFAEDGIPDQRIEVELPHSVSKP